MQRLYCEPDMVGSLLVAGLFDIFERPSQILDSSLDVGIAVNGHGTQLVSNCILSVFYLRRMGEMHERGTAEVISP